MRTKKQEIFKRLAIHRTRKVLHYLGLLSSLANKTNNYEYTSEEVSKIVKTIRKSIKEMEKKFESSMSDDAFEL